MSSGLLDSHRQVSSIKVESKHCLLRTLALCHKSNCSWLGSHSLPSAAISAIECQKTAQQSPEHCAHFSQLYYQICGSTDPALRHHGKLSVSVSGWLYLNEWHFVTVCGFEAVSFSQAHWTEHGSFFFWDCNVLLISKGHCRVNCQTVA